MNVIITESQYKTIISEKFNIELKSITNFYNNLVNKIIKDVKKQFGVSSRFALTYGAGIGALMKPVEEYLSGQFPNLEPWQISSLVIAAISVVYFTGKDYMELKKDLENQGLTDELEVAIEKTESLKDKFADMLNILGLSIYTAKDILAYTFLLPVLGMIINVVTTFGIDSIQFTTLVNAILTSGLITTSGVVVRDVLQSVANKISKRSPNEMGDENI